MQYSLNFLVYAARSKQYRQAYVYFICRVKSWILESVCGMSTTMTHTSHIFYIDQVLDSVNPFSDTDAGSTRAHFWTFFYLNLTLGSAQQ